MKFMNYKIVEYAKILSEIFNNNTLYIPVKANFLIQKNLKKFVEAAEEIEKARLKIGQHYGELDEEKEHYIIPKEKMIIAQQEITDLLNIEQDLDIKTFSIEALGNIDLTPNQMQAIMFMIEE